MKSNEDLKPQKGETEKCSSNLDVEGNSVSHLHYEMKEHRSKDQLMLSFPVSL